MAEPKSNRLLSVEDLRVRFRANRSARRGGPRHVLAVDGVSFHIDRCETLGLVGESGCGKTTIGRAILQLIPADGRVIFESQSVLDLHGRRLLAIRRQMQIVFQDPAGSLNPRLTVGEIVGEPLLVHGVAKGRDLRHRVDDLLVRCGLEKQSRMRFPHEFSGGQRQRIGIARALALNPKLIVCDEPTSALDVSIQSQILNLLKDLQQEFGLSYLFISHDMGVVNHMCDRIAVMRAGKIVEQGRREQVIENPQHEYTQRLLAAVPKLKPAFREN